MSRKTYRKLVTQALRSCNLDKTWKIVRADWNDGINAYQGLLQQKNPSNNNVKFCVLFGLQIDAVVFRSRELHL